MPTHGTTPQHSIVDIVSNTQLIIQLIKVFQTVSLPRGNTVNNLVCKLQCQTMICIQCHLPGGKAMMIFVELIWI